MDKKYRLTLDPQAFDRKPRGKEVGAITRRLQAAGPAEVTAEELARAIVSGHTWCGGCFEPRTDGWGKFLGMQLFGVDIDNATEVLDEDGRPLRDEAGHRVKRSLMPDEPQYLDPWEALSRFNRAFHRDPLMVHATFTHTFDGTIAGRWNPRTRMRYRIVFDAGKPVTDEDTARAVLSKLLEIFPEADSACKNPNRLLFGTRGKLVLFGEGGARYYRGS